MPGGVPRARAHRIPAGRSPARAGLCRGQPSRAREGRGRDPALRGCRRLRGGGRRSLQCGRRVCRGRGARGRPQAVAPQLRGLRRTALFRPGSQPGPSVPDRRGPRGSDRLRGRLEPLGACRSAGRGGRRARRDDQCVAVPCRHPCPAGADARHARGRCILRARLCQPCRRPGRARLRRRLHGLRPRWRPRRVGSAVPRGPRHLRPGDPSDVPQAALGPARPRGHVGVAAGDDLGGRRRFGRRPGRTRRAAVLAPHAHCAPLGPGG